MTTRAKRMIKYLEEELGWSVTQNKSRCSKDETHFSDSGNFCQECGSKMEKIKDTESVKQVEEAIKYTLKE